MALGMRLGGRTPRPRAPRPTIAQLAQRDTQRVYGPAAQAQANALLGRAASDVGRLNARTSSIADALRPYAASAQAAYAQPAALESAVGGALSGALAGGGQQLAGDITGKMAGIQAPGAAIAAAGTPATVGAGAGGAIGALSSAEEARLHSFGSAQEVYAAAFPRLAQLAGEQERRGMMQQYAQELADQQARLMAQEQQALLENQRYYTEQRLQQQATAYAHQQDAYARARQAKLDRIAQLAAQREYGLKLTGVGQAQQRIGISSQNAQTSAQRAAESRRHNRANETLAQRRVADAEAKEMTRHQEAAGRATTQQARDKEHRRHNYVMEGLAKARLRAKKTGATGGLDTFLKGLAQPGKGK